LQGSETYWAKVVCDLCETPAVLLFEYQECDCLPYMLQLIPGRASILFTVTGEEG